MLCSAVASRASLSVSQCVSRGLDKTCFRRYFQSSTGNKLVRSEKTTAHTEQVGQRRLSRSKSRRNGVHQNIQSKRRARGRTYYNRVPYFETSTAWRQGSNNEWCLTKLTCFYKDGLQECNILHSGLAAARSAVGKLIDSQKRISNSRVREAGNPSKFRARENICRDFFAGSHDVELSSRALAA